MGLKIFKKPSWEKPSGFFGLYPNQYGNYMFPPVAQFVVHGTSPKTGRSNKKVFEATCAEEAETMAAAAGLVPPFTTAWEPMEPPTERQLEYAQKIEQEVPQGACKVDMSFLLSWEEDGDTEPAPLWLLEKMAANGWRGSALIGRGWAETWCRENNVNISKK